MNPSPKRISVLIVENHAVVRVGLRTILSQNPRLEIVGEVGTGAAARAETVRLHPQVVLMDLRLPDRTGIEVCRDILDEIPTTRVVFLTSFRDDDSMLAAVLAGASGYLLKEIGPERLSQAVEMVAEGTLRPSVNQKGHRVLAGGVKIGRLDYVAVDLFALPSGEAELLEVPHAGLSHPLVVDVGDRLQAAAVRTYGVKL